MQLQGAVATLLLLCVLAYAVPQPARADEFQYGRATFYDDNNWGSCHFKDVWKLKWYAAYPDTLSGFAGSCGKCFEVSCVKKSFRDGYGQWLDRGSACRDDSKRVVVKITDSCPCVHANAYSNKRWCCGDMPHMDLGREVFKELADEHWGVISIRWKETTCDKLGPQ